MRRVQIGKFELEYEVAGDGPVVLLEAGARCGANHWDRVFPEMASRAQVVRYSRVGHGHSSSTVEQFSARQFAQLAADFLDAIGFKEPVCIAAHSYGSRVAKQFAACFPNRTKGLLLFDPAHFKDVEIVRDIDLHEAEVQLSALKKQDYRSMWPGVDDSWDKSPEPDGKLIGDIPVTVIVSAQRFENPKNLLETDEARVSWVRIQREWANTFPRGKTVVSNDVDHMMVKTHPEFVVKEFDSFLGNLTK